MKTKNGRDVSLTLYLMLSIIALLRYLIPRLIRYIYINYIKDVGR